MSMQIRGYLRALGHNVDEPVQYVLQTEASEMALNQYLGSVVTLSHTGRKACIHCGRKVKKLYQSGYCFPCVTALAECDLCIVKPHECHFHKGTCRDEQFAATHCMIPHYVYLAFSSHVKVGLTRKGRQFTRWIDQGATRAVLLAEVPTRKLAGELEMEVAQFLPDKTDWRKMLRGIVDRDENLSEIKAEVVARLPEQYRSYVLYGEDTVHNFNYPRLDGIEVNVKSLSMDKTDQVSGVLQGIKGQYVLLDGGVFNVKKHAGFEVQVSVS